VRRVILLAISIFTLSAVKAGNNFGRQQGTSDNKKFSFSFNAGVGIPTAGFAKKDSVGRNDTTHAVGFAKPGFHFEVGVSFRFLKNFGIAASIGGSICRFDAAGYASAYGISTSNYNVSSAGSHYIGQYLIGPYFYIPASDNFSIEIKTMVGIVSAQYPDVSILSIMPNNYSGQTYKFAHASGFGYGLSVGGKVKLDNMIGLTFMVSYVGSAVKYDGQVYSISTPSGYTYTGFSFATRDMQLGIVALTGGLCISF
jgi:hypothetical protein